MRFVAELAYSSLETVVQGQSVRFTLHAEEPYRRFCEGLPVFRTEFKDGSVVYNCKPGLGMSVGWDGDDMTAPIGAGEVVVTAEFYDESGRRVATVHDFTTTEMCVYDACSCNPCGCTAAPESDSASFDLVVGETEVTGTLRLSIMDPVGNVQVDEYELRLERTQM